jgi:hypothetical protein
MVADFNDVARTLMHRVVADHPGWERHVFPYGPADDPQADVGSVRFWIPAPHEPEHHLEIAQRGNTIEVAYDCGFRGLRAERQFIFSEGEVAEAVAEVRTFLNALCEGEVVVVRERLGKLVRAIRRDGVEELAWFQTAQEVETGGSSRSVAIHAWRTHPGSGGGAA